MTGNDSLQVWIALKWVLLMKLSARRWQKEKVLDHVLDSVEKDLDSSSNAEACLQKLPSALFIKQNPQGTAVGMDASRAF